MIREGDKDIFAPFDMAGKSQAGDWHGIVAYALLFAWRLVFAIISQRQPPVFNGFRLIESSLN